MTDLPEYDFAHLCAVFATTARQKGLSQARIHARGGPSKPITGKLMNGTWTSTRPAETTEKIDRVFGWPAGTAWRVLTEGYTPARDEGDNGFVGGSPQDAHRYVSSSVSEQVEGGKQDAEVLRAITSMSAALDQLVAGQRDLAQRVDAGQQSLVERVDADAARSNDRFAALEAGLRQLSERVEQLEEPGT